MAESQNTSNSSVTMNVPVPSKGADLILRPQEGANLVLGFFPAAMVRPAGSNDLIVNADGGGKVTLSGFFDAGEGKLPGLTLPDGTVVAANDFLSDTTADLRPAADADPPPDAADPGPDPDPDPGPAPEADAEPPPPVPGSGSGEYTDDTGTLVGGIDRLGSLGSIYWDQGMELTERAIPEIAAFRSAAGSGQNPPPAPFVEPTLSVDPLIPGTPDFPGFPGYPGYSGRSGTPGVPEIPQQPFYRADTEHLILRVDESYMPGGSNNQDGDTPSYPLGFLISGNDGLSSVIVNGVSYTVVGNGLEGFTTVAGANGSLSNAQVIDNGDGTRLLIFEYTQGRPEPHPDPDGKDVARDVDGFEISVVGTYSAAGATVNVDITDDIPEARDDWRHVAEDQARISGNVLLGGAGGDVADVSGYDGWAKDPVALLSGPQGTYGDLTLNADGSYTYTRNGAGVPGEGGQDVFTYQVTDGDGDTAVARLVITLTNTPPTALDPGGTALTVEVHDEHAMGAAVDTHSSTVRLFDGPEDFASMAFTPDAGISVTGSGQPITWTLVDGAWQGSVDGELMLTVTLTGWDADGNVTVSVTQTDPMRHAAGSDLITVSGITVEATDEGGSSVRGRVTVTVIDDHPEAAPDSGTVTQANDYMVQGNVLDNDESGADGWAANPVTTPRTYGGDYGTLVLNADGSYEYRADLTRTIPEGAQETFTYEVIDADGDVASSSLTITLPVFPPPPIPTNVVITVDESAMSTGVGEVTGGCSDRIEHQDLGLNDGWQAVAGEYPSSYGTLVVHDDGTVSFILEEAYGHPQGGVTPEAHNELATGAWTFQVPVVNADGGQDVIDVTLNIYDDGPIACDDTRIMREGEGELYGNVLTGLLADNTLSGDTADASGADGWAANPVVGAGSHWGVYGLLMLQADGSYTYLRNSQGIPDGGAIETFTYEVTDADGDTATATLTIKINNTDPRLEPGVDAICLELRDADVVTPDGSNAAVTVDLFEGPQDFISAAFVSTTAPTVTGAAGVITWVLVNDEWRGSVGNDLVLTVSIESIAEDGTVTISATQTDALRHVEGCDLIEITGIQVVATDEGGSTTPAAPVTVTVADDVPIACDDTRIMREDEGELYGNVLTGLLGDNTLSGDTADASGADGWAANPVMLLGDGEGAYGTLVLNADGSYTYTRNSQGIPDDEEVFDTFTYEVTDADGDTATATLTISINNTDPRLEPGVDEICLELKDEDAVTPGGSNVAVAVDLFEGPQDFISAAFVSTAAPTVTGAAGVITWALVNDEWQGSVGNDLVLTVSIDSIAEDGTVTISATQTDALRHAEGCDLIEITGIQVVATDAGNSTTPAAPVTVTVADDVPTAGNASAVVYESDIEGLETVPNEFLFPGTDSEHHWDASQGAETDWHPTERTTDPQQIATGSLGLDYGADGPGSFAWTEVTPPDGLLALVNGEWREVTWAIAADGISITGQVTYVAEGVEHTVDVMTVTCTDAGTGAYSVELRAAFKHDPPDDDGAADRTWDRNQDINSADPSDFVFAYTVTDNDGDSAAGALTVRVQDDMPYIEDSSTISDPDYEMPYSTDTIIPSTIELDLTQDQSNNPYGVTIWARGLDGNAATVTYNDGAQGSRRGAGVQSGAGPDDVGAIDYREWEEGGAEREESEMLVFDLPDGEVATGISFSVDQFCSSPSDAESVEVGMVLFYLHGKLVHEYMFWSQSANGKDTVDYVIPSGAFDRVVFVAVDNKPDTWDPGMDNSEYTLRNITFRGVAENADMIGYNLGEIDIEFGADGPGNVIVDGFDTCGAYELLGVTSGTVGGQDVTWTVRYDQDCLLWIAEGRVGDRLVGILEFGQEVENNLENVPPVVGWSFIQFIPFDDVDDISIEYAALDGDGDKVSATHTFDALCLGELGPLPAPIAVDDTHRVNEDGDQYVTGNVLDNDTGSAGDTLTVTNPDTYTGAYGTLVLAVDGGYEYTVDPAKVRDFYAGNQYLETKDGLLTDSFAYTITGSSGEIDEAKIIIDIAPNQFKFSYYGVALPGGYGDDVLVGDGDRTEPIYYTMLGGGDGNDILFGDALNADFMLTAEWRADHPWTPDTSLTDGDSLAIVEDYLTKTLHEVDGLPLTNDEIRLFIIENHAEFGKDDTVPDTSGNPRGGTDYLYGGGGDDILYGQGGNDTLQGDRGNDIFYGGGGDDVFMWTSIDLPTNGEIFCDVIKDFTYNAGEHDSINLSPVVSHIAGEPGKPEVTGTEAGDNLKLSFQTTGGGTQEIVIENYAGSFGGDRDAAQQALTDMFDQQNIKLIVGG